MEVYRGIETMPVFAKAGGIVPMQEETDSESVSRNPGKLVIRMFAGADGRFVLYEDDNETCDYEKGICVTTAMELNWEGQQSIVIHPAKGKLELAPETRNYTVELMGCSESGAVCKVDGKELPVQCSYDAWSHCLKMILPDIKVTSEIVIAFDSPVSLAENDVLGQLYAFLDQAEIEFNKKTAVYRLVASGKKPLVVMGQLQAMGLSEDLVKCVSEIITAQG